MARLSISEAARRLNISRQHIYRHIASGKISASGEKGERYVDESEIERVIKSGVLEIKPLSPVRPFGHVMLHQVTPILDSITAGLQREGDLLREQLGKAEAQILDRERTAQDRERWLQGQIDKLTDTIKLLEHRPTVEPVVIPTEDPSVKLVLEAERIRSKELEAQLAAERSRGFFSRLFGGGR